MYDHIVYVVQLCLDNGDKKECALKSAEEWEKQQK
jgi:hypothetical protein